MSEFDLINQFFKTAAVKREDVILGIGDDCALLSPPPGKILAVSTDTLVSGVHFPITTSAEDIGYKSLAVNLSDLAAMGAKPAWVSLAITLPEADQQWLKNFMQGFNELAEKFQLSLVGGDTTRGPLSITVSITGFIDNPHTMLRSNARPGDMVCVTGNIGDAAEGLTAVLNNFDINDAYQYCIKRLNRPDPRIEVGQLLSRHHVAAIDLSDGLLADLNHICQSSNVGAVIDLNKLPISKSLLDISNHQPDWGKILTSGDDYELCFACSDAVMDTIKDALLSVDMQITHIGHITDSNIIECHLEDGSVFNTDKSGFNHFADEK